MTDVSSSTGMREGGESYGVITQPGKFHGFANGDAFEAIDAEHDGLDINREEESYCHEGDMRHRGEHGE